MRALREEKGQVLVLGAVAISVMTVVLVLAIDLATVHLARARLQAGADAAALAAVQEAKPEYEFDISPVFKTERFYVGSDLPPEESIVSKDPVYEWRDVKEHGQATGKKKRELVAWDVKYQVGAGKKVTDAWLDLPDWQASLAAQDVLRRNAAQWHKDGMDFAGPWLVDDSLRAEKTHVQYTVNLGALAVRTQLLGRLTGESDYVPVTVRDQAASVGLGQ